MATKPPTRNGSGPTPWYSGVFSTRQNRHGFQLTFIPFVPVLRGVLADIYPQMGGGLSIWQPEKSKA